LSYPKGYRGGKFLVRKKESLLTVLGAILRKELDFYLITIENALTNMSSSLPAFNAW
jgi:hypothetical protein